MYSRWISVVSVCDLLRPLAAFQLEHVPDLGSADPGPRTTDPAYADLSLEEEKSADFGPTDPGLGS
jgi:hypothetical protein